MKKLTLFFLLIVCFIKANSQTCTSVKELNRKRHKIDGSTYGHPYTTFDRHNGLTFQETIENIRFRIISEKDKQDKPIYTAYKQLYERAIQSMPSNVENETDNGLITVKTANGNTVEGPSARAFWAKENAFVFLIGLNANGEALTLSQRDVFKYNALQAFDNLNGRMDNIWWTALGTALPILGQSLKETIRYRKVQHYSRSLILWLQAYDLLKASAALPEMALIKWENNYNSDADKSECHPRNKLRKLTRDLYKLSEGNLGVVEHKLGWKKNHGIAAASALLMAAQVLNDAGVETDFKNISKYAWIPFIGIGITAVRVVTQPWPRPNYSPINWNKLGNNGMYENIFIGENMQAIKYYLYTLSSLNWNVIINNTPVAEKITNSNNEYAPYAEGPVYSLYGFIDCGLPAMITQKNFFPEWSSDPLIKKNEIINIFNWLNEITINNSLLPTYDNSKYGNHSTLLSLASSKDKNFYYGSISELDKHAADIIALIGGNNININNTPKNEFNIKLAEKGNIILRNNLNQNHHYFHMLAEDNYAISLESYKNIFGFVDEGTHEEEDLGSFMISAWDKNRTPVQLAIDPAYFGWKKVELTNKYWHHNVIEIDDNEYPSHRIYKNPKFDVQKLGNIDGIKEFNLAYDFKGKNTGLIGHAIIRNVKSINTHTNFYYLLNDFINVNSLNNNDFNHVQFNLNGNGNINFNTFFTQNNLHVWKYPCSADSNSWQLIAHVAGLNIPGKSLSHYSNTSNVDNETGTHGEKTGSANEYHTRLQVRHTAKKTIFQSFLLPARCYDELPTVTKQETEHFITTTIRFINGLDTSITTQFYPGPNPNPNTSVNDTSSHFHYVRFNGMEADTVYNPYNLPAHTGKMLTLNAQKAFLRYQTWAESKNGYKFCPPSYLNLHHASISNGSYLQYNDTFIIKSTIPINADIAFAGRYNYIANINPVGAPGATDSVFLYLPDVAAGIDMVAKGYLTAAIAPCNYDSFTRTLAIAMPTENTNFVIEEREKCQNCYFPPTALGIDTLFIINDGRKHTLSHKLTVKQGNGNLHLTNGSKIDMCTEVYLQNKDTIILQGNCQQKPLYAPVCQGIDTALAYNNNSAIIIGNGSALVLDSGSYTHVKSGGAIYVKQNGSLVIKNHAFVQIGDSGTCGWGEIIAEPGAFIHIEPLAHIEYKSTIGDTIDRNLFVLGGGNNNAAFAGVYYLIDTILKLDTVLPIHYTSVDICALDTINPVKNKYWGYTNFAMPLATFSSRNDTLCPREPLHIKLNRILNDAQVQIKVCRMDSILVVDDGSGFTQWKDTCIADSIPINLIQPDPICTPPRIMPDEWTYYFKPNTLNRVTISVINDCGKIHDTVAYIFATDTPKISIHVPDSACEGFGGFAVTASNRTQLPVKYAYEVSEYFNDTQSLLIGTLNPSVVYSFSDVGIVPDSFIFNNYYFKGGRSYIISLSVQNECNSFDIYDTIHIRSGAAILLSKPNVYAEPINGPKSVKLTAIIKQVDSLNWHPALWLNRTDTAIVISTPNDSIGYILTAYTGACLSRDTAIIKYNRVANAGLNDTLCFTNDTALLGNSYDMSIFLGWLYYLGGNEFRDMFMHYTSNQIDYFRYFTHFMMHEEKLQQWASFCPAEIVKTYNNQINRRVIFNLPWFKNYYASFTAFNDANIDAFDYFKTQIETDAGLMANLSGYVNWPVVQDCVNEMFYFYDDFLNNHLQEISSTWIKVSQNDTTVLTAWDEYFVAIDNPQQTSIYIQTVITPQYAEIDEVTVYRDTVLVPYFYAAMQFDSTVYFANATLPFSEATTFTWNFGDGSPISNLDYPIHTFAAFDTSYVVCMTANNKCGSFMYCDTIRIDSSSLSNQRVVYNNSRPGFSNQANNSLNSDKQVVNVLNQPEIFLTNYPNPFGDKTVIDYQIWQPFNNAALVITNTFGQVVHEQKLYKPIDKVSINGNDFASGLYYYSIVVDNATKVTKMMSVMH